MSGEMDQMEEALAQAKAAHRRAPSVETDAALERAKAAIRGARYAVRLAQPPAVPPKVSWVDSPTFVDRFVVVMWCLIVGLWCVRLVLG